MKNWKILHASKSNDKKLKIEDLIEILLENRGVKTKKEIKEFLDPKLDGVTVESVGIDKKQLKKSLARIALAIKNHEQIVVFGDYDVDGIGGTAILWETLDLMGAKVMPYIPHRKDEGYGLSIKGIENIKNQYKDLKLIITVDNGIVANKSVDFANAQGLEVIITDHHVASEKLPNALAIVHTTKLCGTGVAYLLSKEFIGGSVKSNPSHACQAGELGLRPPFRQGSHSLHAVGSPSSFATPRLNNHLELVALATVADLVPLKGANRTLLKFGLEALHDTKRIGLLELLKESGLVKQAVGVYEIGHMIAPRLNAMGRLEYAMDSLRLICARNQKKAEELAQLLGSTNKERQNITLEAVMHAIEKVKSQKAKVKSLLFIVHESYEQGVIGLVAGKLVEEFYKPAIVISKGEKFSKASARSVSGFNIIEFIRSASEFLVDAGGHPMAAGFTVETAKLPLLQKALEDRAETLLNKDLLTRILKVDSELPLAVIDASLYDSLQRLAPFGMGNPEPTFISRDVIVEDVRAIGMDGKHLKLKLKNDGKELDAIAFGMGKMFSEIKIGGKVDIVYTIDENEWNGEKRLQLKIKDIAKDKS